MLKPIRFITNVDIDITILNKEKILRINNFVFNNLNNVYSLF